VIPLSELEKLADRLNEQVVQLMRCKTPMPAPLYNGVPAKDEEGNDVMVPPMFADRITYTLSIPNPQTGGTEKSEVTLYLDRSIYPIDPANEIWVRYVSVGRSCDEEDPSEIEDKKPQTPQEPPEPGPDEPPQPGPEDELG
jgi:hypothetical protein